MKHVGKVIKTGTKCLVVYRTLPGDAYSALIVSTQNLPDDQHNALIQVVEGTSAQSAFELHEVLARSRFPDGSIMLPTLHVQGKLLKVPTADIEMTPNFQARINLAELNQIIAEQRGVSVQDLAITNTNAPQGVEVQEVGTVKDISPEAKTTSQSINEAEQAAVPAAPEILTDEALAAQYRSQADAMYKEAKRLREQAEELVPTIKRKAPAKKAAAKTRTTKSKEQVGE